MNDDLKENVFDDNPVFKFDQDEVEYLRTNGSINHDDFIYRNNDKD